MAPPPDGKKTPIDSGVIARAAGMVKELLGLGARAQQQIQSEKVEPKVAFPMERPNAPSQVQRSDIPGGSAGRDWFGPGQPIAPQAPREEVAGRAFDYPAGYNLTTKPRRGEALDFATLQGVADTYDLLRMAIQTRKEQVAKVKWNVLPKKPPGQRHSTKPDETCRRVEAFLRKPDGVHHWSEWVKMVAEATYVCDAVPLYRRRTRDGRPFALEVIDPATVSVLIDRTGRRPLPPNPAYQQINKGIAVAEYTADEMTYAVRNPRAHKVYGHSEVEQIINYVNIGLRRMAGQMNHYTEGNIPEALMGVPETWSVEQIRNFQAYWDSLMENAAHRRRMKFVPAGLNFMPTHGEAGAALMDPFDEWLARVVCYAFSLPPLPFVKMQNRATAETAYETALEEGLEPTLEWLKRFIDDEIEHFLEAPGYEIVWDDIRRVDVAEQHQMDHADVQRGIKSIDEVRTARGDEPLGLPHIVWGVGPIGFMSVEAVKKAIEQGLDMPQPPPPPDMMMGGMPGEDPLAGADPALLAELGIPGQGAPSDQQPPAPSGSAAEEDTGEAEDEEGSGGSALPSSAAPQPRRGRGGDPRVAARLQQLRGRYRIGASR